MFVAVFVAGCVRTLKIQEIVVLSGHGRVTARGGRVRAERSEVTERNEVTARGGICRAERGVGSAMCGRVTKPSEASCGLRITKAERSEVWVTQC